MEFTLNGRPVSVEMRDGESLLDLLRERCGLTSMKDGCAPEGSCGACTVLVDGKAGPLREPTPARPREEISRSLAGNLCRCTGYIKIIEAVQYAAAAGRGEPVPAPDWSGRVGSRTGRYQGRELALGMKPYVNDLREPGMLYGAVCWSDHPRAKVRRIDASRARAHPEVVAVATWQDVPGERKQGLITKDWRQVGAAGGRTNYVGAGLPGGGGA